ncbi:MAG: hypothetical protein ACUBOA_05285 [Candidatus Loosdrechtia sp.]|uniref:hypothetical protein n=1 Tax=Candidatus Loosdrechtia sp. TaxID=3101272 RepID=UPI003A767C58|nr:MAG: hypothetical protein QY305_07425 [Candidatus Jettenia sp. AMX2]
MTNPSNQDAVTILSAIRDVRLSNLLIFIGINLRFVTGDIINALVFFAIVQSPNPNNRYDIHTPSPPDMCGDVLTALVFTAAYFFHTSAQIKKTIINPEQEVKLYNSEASQLLRDSLEWSRRFLFTTIIAFGLYFFSQYFLSVGLAIVSFEISEERADTWSTLNALIIICSSSIFVYAYCLYLGTNRAVAIILYLFFFIRNFFATNMLGLSSKYDIHIYAPFLDVLSPFIILYSVSSIMEHGRLKLKPPLNSLRST